VEIAPNARPPVCKIVDYGKYMYDLSKQQKEQTKPKTKVKEVKFRVRTEEHDYNIKLCHAEDFLEHGDKLRIQLQFRGRENAHRELGFELMQRIKEDLVTMAKVDAEPKLAGRQIVMMMSPLPKDQQKRHFHVHKGKSFIEEDDFEDDEEDFEEEEFDNEDDGDTSADSGGKKKKEAEEEEEENLTEEEKILKLVEQEDDGHPKKKKH